jgi:uncharacterized protein with FMN-binding domain
VRKPGKFGLILVSVIVVLGAVFLAGSMSFGIPRQNWTPTDPDLSAVADGVYRGEYRIVPPFGSFAVYRKIAVEVDVRAHVIARITVLSPEQVVESLAAVGKRVMAEQSLQVDALSAGTWSSRAYLKAIEAALRGD